MENRCVVKYGGKQSNIARVKFQIFKDISINFPYIPWPPKWKDMVVFLEGCYQVSRIQEPTTLVVKLNTDGSTLDNPGRMGAGTMEDDYEFTLEDENNMLLPYARDQGKMNACYSYSTGEAVQALYASTYSVPPFELSTQQIVDHMPIMFDYKNLKRKKDKVDCHYSNHPHTLRYIWREGLVRDEHYPKRESRKEKDIISVPKDVPRYGIRSFDFVFQRGMPLELKKSSETEKTVEEINDILRKQPMAGATTVYKSFKDFKGEVLNGFSNELFRAKIKEKRSALSIIFLCVLLGVELKPGKPFTLNFEKERGSLHVSQATSSTGSTSMTSIVQCQVGDKKAICICSLLPEKQERCLLNLEFEEDHEDITFLVIGSHSVHLSGFFYGESEDCFGDEYASDPYEEGAAEIDSESSDSIKFEDVAEDGDKDGSTDDAFKILEEEEPRDESGTLKRPKKKKHHLNVTYEEENLIVIKGNTDSPLSESEDEDGFSLRESKSKSATSKKLDGIEDEDTREEALNEKARGIDVDERKGLRRIVCEDTSKTYDYQSIGEQIKQKKVMDGEELAGAHPEHVEANTKPIDDDFCMYLPSPVPNSGGLVELRLFSLVFISLLIHLEIGSYVERVTGFKKALLGPRLLEDERLKKKSSLSTDEEKKEMSLVPYSYAVGSLMYAMVCTRPDIARYC
ncbi:Peptidyl-prolyl cis-trans isomerase FKBP53 [Capsicum baccatum]|uniref:peptidylprolyl isomerase n=1 Tax=Capsicum baccatum TaxID=33114 RepID=A0A2G2V397_CAPBA|nr:Peptidyl-prolyl cis-trans isomerase FKBP53 [Capsicum baccatum]